MNKRGVEMFDDTAQNQPGQDGTGLDPTAGGVLGPANDAPAAPATSATEPTAPAAPPAPADPASQPVADPITFNTSSVETPVTDPVTSVPAPEPAATATEPAPAVPAPETTASSQPSVNPAVDSGLLDIKQQALQSLSPLLGQLEQSPEEKFKTTMMMIQASDDQSLVKAAYEAANQITDEKAKAQALLDVVNEINYFTQHGQNS